VRWIANLPRLRESNRWCSLGKCTRSHEWGIDTAREPVKVNIRSTGAKSYAATENSKSRAAASLSRALQRITVDARGNLQMLMTRYQAGDVSAATSLIDALSPQLHRFLAAQFASRADADDLLQETWLRIHKVRHTYRPGEPVLPWLYAIARHVGVDHYRRTTRNAARERRLEEMSEVTATSPREYHQADELEALLQPLSKSQREVIEMLKVADMSLEEVARATSCSVGSVKQKVHRAYEILRKRMNAASPSKGQGGALP